MRVVDLDRDMRDVIPTGTSRDSEFLFDRMTNRTLELAGAAPGRRILDVASGFGQDARVLACRGALVVAAEPSARMSGLARLQDPDPREDVDRAPAASAGAGLLHLRAWADALPFADASFDAVICKGAIDHFDAPLLAVGEMARVTRPDGQVVLAIANFDSLSCRIARGLDGIREAGFGQALPRGRRHYDVPHDHFTRYELPLMREQAEAYLRLDVVEGISLAWGLPRWTRTLQTLPEVVAGAALRAFDQLARTWPAIADVIVLAGSPRRSATTSA